MFQTPLIITLCYEVIFFMVNIKMPRVYNNNKYSCNNKNNTNYRQRDDDS